ncbi:MAG: hypothetical protein M3540_08965, partial [Actinomycetota bacterium]|nr:hypothetical protein [Actinomycetota bacterium]
DHCDLDAIDPGDPIRDLVDGAVSTHDDEQLRAVPRGLGGELRQLAGPLGEEGVAREPVGCGSARDLGPAPARRPVGRRGIDEKDGVSQP